MEVILHVGDQDVQTNADRLMSHMGSFRMTGRSANDKGVHYESCEVSVEKKTWEQVK